jgi:hypothetical protein
MKDEVKAGKVEEATVTRIREIIDEKELLE